MPTPGQSLRGTLIVQFASVFHLSGVPGRSRVSKMGLKIGFKRLLMQDILQDLAQGALWVWVQDKTS